MQAFPIVCYGSTELLQENPKEAKTHGQSTSFYVIFTLSIFLWWKHNIPYKPQWASQMSLQIRQVSDMQRLLNS